MTLNMHVFGLRNSAHTFWHMNFLYGFPIDKHRHTDIHISHEILIEQPSVGLALLGQLISERAKRASTYKWKSVIYIYMYVRIVFLWYVHARVYE